METRPLNEQLLALVDNDQLRPLDYQFAKYIVAQDANPSPLVAYSAALVSRELGRNHSCLDLTQAAQQPLFADVDDPAANAPDLKAWRQALLASACVGGPDDGCPLVIDGNRLYLSRYWHYENATTGALLTRTGSTLEPAPESGLEPASGESNGDDQPLDPLADLLRVLFDITGDDLSEAQIAELRRKQRWQEVAVAMAVQRRFAVICGGPGTGKTTTVTKLLALLLRQAQLQTPDRKLKVRLAAPTGKAAARLTQSIRDALHGDRGLCGQLALADYQALLAEIPEEATTLHRLLGVQRHSSEFRHNRQNPLRCDVLVVDEASMVDLPMMAKTIAALPDKSRLILLGDKDQLASVEAGSVLADMYYGLDIDRFPVTMRYSRAMLEQIETLTGHNLSEHRDQNTDTPGGSFGDSFGDNLCLLQDSFRFQGGIGALATAINQGQADLAMALLEPSVAPEEKKHQDIRLTPVNDPSRELLLKLAQAGYSAYLKRPPQDPEAVLKAFEQFRVLCALRRGDDGVEGLNQAIEQRLQRAGLIRTGAEFYPGRPIMITENSYELQLFNGDIGILLENPNNPGEVRANFLMPDNQIKAFVPTQLPAHDTAYAMTVHKSQGSEFAHTCLVLPERVEEQGKGILTRELVYTGLTRAKKMLDIFANEPMLRMAIEQKTQRASGLGEKLWGE